MMPQLSEPAVAVMGGSTATTMRASSGGDARLFEPVALPQAGEALLDDQALRVPVRRTRCRHSGGSCRRETKRKVLRVVGGAGAGERGHGIDRDAFEKRVAARRGGDDHLRMLP